MQHEDRLNKIKFIHTLGPEDTNCSNSAKKWLVERNKSPDVILYETLELAIKEVPKHEEHALMASCIAYPDLHTLMFTNQKKFFLHECVVYPTYNMVLASRDGKVPQSVATHPAPQSLIPANCLIRYTTSNAQAAIDCASGLTDGCITTLPAAINNKLLLVNDFGEIRMGFTIHCPLLK